MPQPCRLYGLGVRVNVDLAALAALPPAESVDVDVRFVDAPPAACEAGGWERYYESPERGGNGLPHVRVSRRARPELFRVEYDDGTRIYVDGAGERVFAVGARGAGVEDTATYLLGPTLGFVLRMRGVVCLHASAIAFAGRAIAIAAPPGFGKSTAAAALAQRGHAILSDDVTALVDGGDRFAVRPAYPRIRLWPASVEQLFGAADALPAITPGWDKRFLALDGARFRFQAEELPLCAIYILGDRGTNPGGPRIEPMDGGDALIHLVGNTHSNLLLDRGMRAREFELLGRLARNVPVRHVLASSEFARIGELCEALERDV